MSISNELRYLLNMPNSNNSFDACETVERPLIKIIYGSDPIKLNSEFLNKVI